jgi:hypothetical protein
MRAGRIVQVDAERDGDVAVSRLASAPIPEDLSGPLALVALPGALSLADDGDRTGEVVARGFAGDHVIVRVALDAGPTVRVPVWRGEPPHVGDRVRVSVDPDALRVVPRG